MKPNAKGFRRSTVPARLLCAMATAGLASMLTTTPAAAVGDGFSDVSFAVSGSPGAWLLNFTVTATNPSNMEPKSFIKTFTIGPEGGAAVAQPFGFSATTMGGSTTWNGMVAAGAPTPANSLRLAFPGGIGGFESLVTSDAAPTSVAWSVLLASGNFTQDFYVGGDVYVPTVSDSGVAFSNVVMPPVPEPEIAGLMLLGFGALVAASRRKRARLEHATL